MSEAPIPILVTGADGLLGRHARAAVLALNGAARFAGQGEPWLLRVARRRDLDDAERLAALVDGAGAVLHFAGINRADDEQLEHGNRRLAERLVAALERVTGTAHVVFANSTRSSLDEPYGRGKAAAARVLGKWARQAGARFSDVVLPHVFGEGGRPFHNSVTATLCRQIVDGTAPTIHDGALVELVHAGAVADAMLDAVRDGRDGTRRLHGESVAVAALYQRLLGFQQDQQQGRFPAVSRPLDVALFNTLRAAGFPGNAATELALHSDVRGTLFEAAKGGAGGQTFLSWTDPGMVRGNHFHRYKIERFVVISGRARIAIRDVLGDEVHLYNVDGQRPVAVDMPTLHTHSIVNAGEVPLLTLFWAHEIFDPERPDTWAEPVLVDGARQIVRDFACAAESPSGASLRT